MTKFTRSQRCKNCEDCNEMSPLFKLLDKSELKIMNKDRFEVLFKPGEIIFKQGTAATHMISMLSGMAKIYIEGLNNKNQILKIIKPWAMVGGPGLYYEGRHHYSIAALEETSTCFIDINNFKQVVRNNGVFANQFILNMSKNSIFLFERLISLTQKQMHGRMADALLYLVNEIYNNNKFVLNLSRQDMAELTAMSKDSAIRILKEFHNDGIINLNGKKIEIPDIELLTVISDRG